jgi:hypothetical protein
MGLDMYLFKTKRVEGITPEQLMNVKWQKLQKNI